MQRGISHGPRGGMRGWQRWAARAALLAGSLAFSFGVIEVGLRLAGYEAIYDVYSKPSVLWRKDPLLGWHHRPNHRELYVGPRPWPIEFETPIEINALGLRGPELVPKPPGAKRILFLGDSVVAAFEVPYEKTFVDRVRAPIEARLGVPVETINGGVRGYGTDQSLLYYRERGRLLEPDLVVFIHAINDLRNNMTLHRRRRPFGKGAFGVRGSGPLAALELRGTPVPDYPLCEHVVLNAAFEVEAVESPLARAVCELEVRLADHSALFTFVTNRIQQSPAVFDWLRTLGGPDAGASGRDPGQGMGFRLPFGPGDLLGARSAWAAEPEPRARRREGSQEPRYRLTSRILLELAREVRRNGSELLIVMREPDRERMNQRAIRAEGARIRTVRFPVEKLQGRSWRWVNDGHYNELGHELAAEALAPAVAGALEGRPRRGDRAGTERLPEDPSSWQASGDGHAPDAVGRTEEASR